jgi:hypothetical protein
LTGLDVDRGLDAAEVGGVAFVGKAVYRPRLMGHLVGAYAA